MTYEQFWLDDPYLVKAYEKAHELRNQQRNQEMWFQGLYNYRAFSSVLAQFSHAMSGGKGSKPEGYLEEPIPLTEEEQKAAQERKQQRALAWAEANQ